MELEVGYKIFQCTGCRNITQLTGSRSTSLWYVWGLVASSNMLHIKRQVSSLNKTVEKSLISVRAFPYRSYLQVGEKNDQYLHEVEDECNFQYSFSSFMLFF